MEKFLVREFGKLRIVGTKCVKFSLRNNILRAKYNNNSYRVHYLDLSHSEQSKFIGADACDDIVLVFHFTEIVIVGNVLNIKRIPSKTAENDIERIEFSSSEPLMAQYNGEVYLVNHDLQSRYKGLLHETEWLCGTAIRINKIHDWILVNQTNTLTFRTKSVGVKLIKYVEKRYENTTNEKIPENSDVKQKYLRYIVGSGFSLLAVEQRLMPSSIVCECKEIYVEYRYEENYDKRLSMCALSDYEVPSEICRIVRDKENFAEVMPELNQWFENTETLKPSESSYVSNLRAMIAFEEQEQLSFLNAFNLTDIKLIHVSMDNVNIPINDRMTDICAAIDENFVDRCCLIPSGTTRTEIFGRIDKRSEKNIYLTIFNDSIDNAKIFCHNDSAYLFDIKFLGNRRVFQLQHQALDYVEMHKLFSRLLYSEKLFTYQQLDGTHNELRENDSLVGTSLEYLNTEQLNAVENIIKGRNHPHPYILFGPPGTGKTKTLVAAIEQIIRNTDKNVLVCAMSNAACDEIADRLVDFLSSDEMCRMYAGSQKPGKYSRIDAMSNLASGQHSFPGLKYLYKYRVLVCTLSTSGCLTRARYDPHFTSKHFSYVFIDECASSHESMALIPIAGLCTSWSKVETNIVLAGDPKQLGAITKNNIAKQLGYSISLMERLMEYDLYKRNPVSGEFNSNYITQLVKNYRSHPDILKIPNELFYESKLEASASACITDWFIDSSLLPAKKFPIIFESVQGKSEKAVNDFSCYNANEAHVVMRYIKLLLTKTGEEKTITQADIGVVTPYKKQCQIILQLCKHNGLNNITVGTAEAFQGKERPVMIISTVRSGGTSLGFVNDPRRLNVVITRAKCLLIIVGDPFTLCLDHNWHRFIQFCMQNNGFKQSQNHFRLC